MGINVHSRGNVLVAEAFLGNLNLNTLLDHDGRTQVPQIMESTFGEIRRDTPPGVSG